MVAERSPTPILIVARGDDPNRHASYLAELLLIEGYPWFEVCDLAAQPLDPGRLATAGVVLLADVGLDRATEETLLRFLREGGRLLSQRPLAGIAAGAGLRVRPGEWADRYLVPASGCPLLAGLEAPLTGWQYRGSAVRYDLPGSSEPGPEVLAWLAPYPEQRTWHPAVVTARVGAGRLGVFAYDLAECVLLLRQGARAQSSLGPSPDFDGDRVFRPNDLFAGWLDPALRDVPQADLHGDLLVRLLRWLTIPEGGRQKAEGGTGGLGLPSAFRLLPSGLPRVWHFPAAAPAIAVLGGDSDSMGLAELNAMLATCERYGMRYTAYLKSEHVAVLGAEAEAAYRRRGHAFGLHPWAGPLPTVEALAEQVAADADAFHRRYGYRAVAQRSHWCVWPGWVEHARTLAAAGIRLDTSFLAGRYLQGGYVNGSALPARFLAEDGTFVDLYEQATCSADDSWLTDKTGWPAMTVEQAIARSYQQIDGVLRTHGVYHPYFHPVCLREGHRLQTRAWVEAVAARCAACHLPSLTADEWVRFEAARRSLELTSCASEATGDAQRTAWTFRARAAIREVTILLPLWPSTPAGLEQLELWLDGAVAPVHRPLLDGRRDVAVILSFEAGQTHTVELRGQ